MQNTLVVSYPYERVLVVILASALAIFLILAIIIAVKVLKFINRANSLVAKAEDVVEKIEDVGNVVNRAAGSMAIGSTIAKAAESIFKRGSSKHNKGE